MRYDDPRWYEQPEQHNPQAFPPGTPAQQSDQQINAGSFLLPPEETVQPSRGRRILGQIVLTLAFMALAFLGGWFAHQAYNSGSLGSQSQQYLTLFQQAWNIVLLQNQ